MKGIILAGGAGTRLHPVTLEVPKPLLTVKKKPIINYLVDLFYAHNVSDITLSINNDHLEDFLKWRQEHYGDKHIQFFLEQEPQGTMGAVKELVQNWPEHEPIFVSNGDALMTINLSQMVEHHEKHPGSATIALHEVEDARSYGVVLTDKDHKVKKFLEKPKNPPSNYISAGMYLIDVGAIARMPSQKFLMFEKDLFPQLVKTNELYAYPGMKKWLDCGTFESWQEAMNTW